MIDVPTGIFICRECWNRFFYFHGINSTIMLSVNVYNTRPSAGRAKDELCFIRKTDQIPIIGLFETSSLHLCMPKICRISSLAFTVSQIFRSENPYAHNTNSYLHTQYNIIVIIQLFIFTLLTGYVTVNITRVTHFPGGTFQTQKSIK